VTGRAAKEDVMRDKIRNLLEALLLTFCKVHEVQFNAPWKRSTPRC
jgi:hypothetical protein